jgi:hypothetical protein
LLYFVQESCRCLCAFFRAPLQSSILAHDSSGVVKAAVDAGDRQKDAQELIALARCGRTSVLESMRLVG